MTPPQTIQNHPSIEAHMISELSDAELHLYSRHVLLDGWDIEAQQKLKSSHVLIIGAGGIGCTSAELLARAGVGHLTLIDFDYIEISNLQRQIAFEYADLGQFKAQALAARIQRINPHIQISVYTERFDSNLIEKIKADQSNRHTPKFDLILDGCDNFATRYLVNQFALDQHVPLLSAAAIAFEGQLLFVQGQPCYHCIFPQQQDAADERRCANSGVLTTTPVVMASLQAHHALLFLGLSQVPLRNKLLLWNGQTMQQRILNLSSDPECLVCAVDKSTVSLR